MLLRLPVVALLLGQLVMLPDTLAAEDDAPDAAQRATQAWAAQDFSAAAEAYADVLAENDSDFQAWYRMGYALHVLGRYDEAVKAHDQAAVSGSPFAATAGFNATCARALLGETDAAFAALDNAIAAGFSDPKLLATDTDLTALRSDPRFAKIMARFSGPTPPSAELLAELRRDFDPWVGEWDAQPRVLDANGAFIDGGWLKVTVVAVLGGDLILEYTEGSIGPGAALSTVGYSLRAVDPTTGVWELMLNWPSKGAASFGTLRGSWRHHRGEFFSQSSPNGQGGSYQRYSFSDFGSDHMRWDGANTQDGGKTWLPNLIFEKTRRAADAAALWDGASRSNDWGNTPGFREFDFAIGEWHGKREHLDGSSLHVVRRLRSVLEGTMIEEFVELDGEETEYSIRGHVPQRSDWSEYSLSRQDTTLRKAIGVLSGSKASFTGGWQSVEHPGFRTVVERNGDTLLLSRDVRDASGAWRAEWSEALELVSSR